MEKKLQEIASHFALEGGIAVIDSLGEGFINDTFIIRTEGEAPDYILQRKNKNIFPDVPAMMDNIRRVTDHIRRGVIAAGGDPRREVMTVVPTREGALYHIDGDTYYKVKYPGHNLVRTHAQYRLLQSMEEHYGEMCRIVRETVDKYRKA